jgi:hypothetical protein
MAGRTRAGSVPQCAHAIVDHASIVCDCGGREFGVTPNQGRRVDVESAGEVLQGRAECGSGGGGLSGAHEEVERGGLGVGGVLMASVADAATPGASRPSREAGHWYAPCSSTAAAWDKSATSSTSRWAATQKGGD